MKTEEYSLSNHNPNRKEYFILEKTNLQSLLPRSVIGVIEHIGSTAIHSIKSKPIIDILVEVNSQQEAKSILGPLLEEQGYTHIIHKGLTQDEPQESSWFIKRNEKGDRTHHIRCAEKNTPIRNRVLFVKYLNDNPSIAQEYEDLKDSLLSQYPGQRRKYLDGKSEFIKTITKIATSKYGEYKS